jgi:hypothetical protein
MKDRRGCQVPLFEPYDEIWFYGKDVQPAELLFDDWKDYGEYCEFYEITHIRSVIIRVIPASNELKEDGCQSQFIETKKEGRGAFWVTQLTVKAKERADR